MANPFENQDGTFHVLTNHEGQYSLWPSFIDVPTGWAVALREDTRTACLDYINEHWTDMRPKSLIEAVENSSLKKKKKLPGNTKKIVNGVVN